MKLLCSNCLRYHSGKCKLKKFVLVICENCNHKQRTKTIVVKNIICSICLKKKMIRLKVDKNG